MLENLNTIQKHVNKWLLQNIIATMKFINGELNKALVFKLTLKKEHCQFFFHKI